MIGRLGLVEGEERNTLSGLLRWEAARISLSGLSGLLSQWPGSPEAVAHTWMERFRQRVEELVQAEHQRRKAERPKRSGRPTATVVTGDLIFDDSVPVKPQGRTMGGRGQHYSNSERRNVLGHGWFTGLSRWLGQRCPPPMQLYRQQSVGQQDGVTWESKIEMATHPSEGFAPIAGTATQVLIDSGYPCRAVRRAAQKRGWEVRGGLKCNRVLRLISEEGQHQGLKLSAYAASLNRQDGREGPWPAEQHGQTMDVHLVQTGVRKLGSTLWLVTGHHPDQPLKSVRDWGSPLLKLDAQALVDLLAIRWNIETVFESDQDLWGSDPDPLMSAQAILRFSRKDTGTVWTLMACRMDFREEQRVAWVSSPFTCGDARRESQEQPRIKLRLWLKDQFQANSSFDQISAQLAL